MIDSSIYEQSTVKTPTSKKSLLHAEYVDYYSTNKTMLILQHNNLTQSQLLKIRSDLKTSNAKLRVIRVGIFEHAVKVATVKDSPDFAESWNVNSKAISRSAKKNKVVDGLDLTQLLTGPICAVTFPTSVEAAAGGERKEVTPADLKAVIGTIQKTQGKLLLVGGKFEGQVFSVDSLDRVSKLPGLDILRGQVLSLLGAPAFRLSQLLGTPASVMGRTLEGRKVAMEEEQGSSPAEEQK